MAGSLQRQTQVIGRPGVTHTTKTGAVTFAHDEFESSQLLANVSFFSQLKGLMICSHDFMLEVELGQLQEKGF